MGKLNAELASSLLESIKGDGEPIKFSQEDIEEGRARYAAACEKSEIEARFHQAKALEEASRTYLTF
jgi:hypothetical protein